MRIRYFFNSFLRGFTLIEITVATLIVAILVAITLPVLSRIRMDMNEAAAITSIRTLTTAMENYRIANGSYYLATLNILGSANPAYIDKTLGCNAGWCIKQGYQFALVGAIGGNRNTYLIQAWPGTPQVTGKRFFCATEDGVIKYSNIMLAGYATCKGASSINN